MGEGGRNLAPSTVINSVVDRYHCRHVLLCVCVLVCRRVFVCVCASARICMCVCVCVCVGV